MCFDKGKWLGIYFHKTCSQTVVPDVTYRGQCGSKLPIWYSTALDFRRHPLQHFGCVYFVMREFHG